ncbi:hypothetical protein KS4_00920 [Poriferisphaera corsica]|uniref:ABC-2 family transporter protein n=1 Tax=Poriferisphaera corsica TaxID=2528020 RepID=A0A517YPC1_9BACT|nr:hypothetical protein [Poriferisphaera corsica]QDU32063.1 hypothetical protein KS4_00920 [Poriferisphaera corsica]
MNIQAVLRVRYINMSKSSDHNDWNEEDDAKHLSASSGDEDVPSKLPDAGTLKSGNKNQPSRMALRAAELRDANIRVLTLLWCLWLLGAWLVVALLGGGNEGVRWMVFGAAIGLFGVWPAFRLSSIGSRWLVRKKKYLMVGEVFMEWLSLIVVLQAVIWPLQITGGWYIEQTILINGLLIGWSLLTGIVVACGAMSVHGSRRIIAMLICMVLVFGLALLEFTPLQRLLTVEVTGTNYTFSVVNSLEQLWLLSAGDGGLGLDVYDKEIWWITIGAVMGLGICGWVVLKMIVSTKAK